MEFEPDEVVDCSGLRRLMPILKTNGEVKCFRFAMPAIQDMESGNLWCVLLGSRSDGEGTRLPAKL